MARGRGRGADGATSPATATPRPKAETAPATPTAIVAQVFTDTGLEVDRLVDAAVESRIGSFTDWAEDPALRDTARPASALYRAAAEASAGDPQSCLLALKLIEAADTDQRAYLARLEDAAANPRKRTSHEMWRVAGCRSTDPSAHRRLELDGQELLEDISRLRSLLTDSSRSADFSQERVARRNRHGYSRTVLDKMNLLLGQSLSADDHARTRGLRAAYLSVMGEADDEEIADEDLERAGRLQRALSAIGRGHTTNWIAEIRDVSQERLDRLQRPRQAGEAIEKEILGTPDGYASPSRAERLGIPAAESAQEVLSRARAMARIPNRFRAKVQAPSGSNAPNVELIVPVTADGLKDFLDHARHGGFFKGVALVDEYATNRGGKRELSLQVRAAASLPDQDVILNARLRLGVTAYTSPESQMKWLMSEVAPQLGVEEIVGSARREDWTGPRMSSRAPAIVNRERHVDGARPVKSLKQLIGEDRCAHPKASWSRAGERDDATIRTPDTGRLVCPDCLRTMIAAEPLHRFPAGHPILDGVTEESYLASERFYAELRGDRQPIRSIADLRERDGLAQLDPTAYAIGLAVAGRRPTIAQAMNRR